MHCAIDAPTQPNHLSLHRATAIPAPLRSKPIWRCSTSTGKRSGDRCLPRATVGKTSPANYLCLMDAGAP